MSSEMFLCSSTALVAWASSKALLLLLKTIRLFVWQQQCTIDENLDVYLYRKEDFRDFFLLLSWREPHQRLRHSVPLLLKLSLIIICFDEIHRDVFLFSWCEPHQRFRHGVPLLLLAALRDLVVVVELVKGVEYLGRRLNLIIFHN